MERNKVLMIALLIMGMSTTQVMCPPALSMPEQMIPAKIRTLGTQVQTTVTGYWNQLLDKVSELKVGVPSTPVETSTPALTTPSTPAAEIPTTTALGTATTYLTCGLIATVIGKKIHNYFYNQTMVSDITQNTDDIEKMQLTIAHNDQEYVKTFYPQTNGTFKAMGSDREIAFAELDTFLGNELKNNILKNVDTGTCHVTFDIVVFLKNKSIARNLAPTTVRLNHTKNTDQFGKGLWKHYLAPRMRVLPYQKEEKATVATDKELIKVEAFITHNQILTSPAILSALVPPALILGGVTNKYVVGTSLLIAPVWNYINKANPTLKATLPNGVTLDRVHFSEETDGKLAEKIKEFNADTDNHAEREYTIAIVRHYKDTASNETMRYKFAPVKLTLGQKFGSSTREPGTTVSDAQLTAALGL